MTKITEAPKFEQRHIEALGNAIANLKAYREMNGFPSEMRNTDGLAELPALLRELVAENERLKAAQAPAVQDAEPVAWMQADGSLHTTRDSAYFKPGPVTRLYASPQAAAAPATRYEYYYKDNSCEARTCESVSCICWHEQGSGPFPDALPTTHSQVVLIWRPIRFAAPTPKGAES